MSEAQDLFYEEVSQPSHQVDLLKSALYIALHEYPHLNIDDYLSRFDRLAFNIKKRLPIDRYPMKVVQVINNYLFKELQFTGNSRNYYDPKNSFINDVLDQRTGIPITLSVVYLEIAKRLNFPMVGIGLPGHFIIRPDFEDVGIYIDSFNEGEILFEQDCEKRLSQVHQHPIKLQPEFLQPINSLQILVRILTNLKYIYLNNLDYYKALGTVEWILMIIPDNLREIRDRGLMNYQLEEWGQAKYDLEYYLSLIPQGDDADIIRQLLEKIP